MKVVQVTCPSCNRPVYMKEPDTLFYCEYCNMMHARDGGVEKVDFEIGEFGLNTPTGDRMYVPFWRLYCSFAIHSKSVQGGQLFRLASWLKGDTGSGTLFVFIPAAEFDVATFKRLSTGFTANPPRYATRLNFGGVRRVPTSLRKEQASELADFVVVTMEAEKPGVLQNLNYTLTVNDAKMVYLPFVVNQSGMAVAF
jgi:hypothetical protein